MATESRLPTGWFKYATIEGYIISINRFEESVPLENIMEGYGFTVYDVGTRAKDLIS